MKIPKILKKSKLKRILEKHRKFINSEAYIKLIETECSIKDIFRKESKKCKHFKSMDDLASFCMHKKRKTELCGLFTCPLRK